MTDDPDSPEEPTPSDGTPEDESGSSDPADGSNESDAVDDSTGSDRADDAGDADAGDESPAEGDTGDAEDGAAAGDAETGGEGDAEDGVTDDAGDGTAADAEEVAGEADDTEGADGAAPAAHPGEELAAEDPDADATAAGGVQPDPDASAAAGPPASEPASADGDESGTTAAERGMDAVSSGLDALGGDGPESDREMPLAAHIEEMMRRLAVVLAVGVTVSLAVLFAGNVTAAVPSAEEIIRYFWDYHIGFQRYRPHVYGPLEFILTKLKVVSLAGLLVGLPVFVYETYAFMRPGLYPHERRYYLAAIPTSLVLGVVGATFTHFVVLPFIFDYFIAYTKDTAVVAFGLQQTFNLILIMMGYMAIVFQIPLFVQLAIMMNVVSRQWMEDRRLVFWGVFLGLSFTFVAVDPTGFAPIIIAATMIVLFEGTLALLRWTGN